MKFRAQLLAVAVVVCLMMPAAQAGETPLQDGDVISFTDEGVEKQIRLILERPEGDITLADMEAIESFVYHPQMVEDYQKDAILDISDLRYCRNLRQLQISGQPIVSVEAVRNLEKLEEFNIHGCTGVTDLSPLAGKTGITSVWMNGAQVEDISPVLSLPNLVFFNASWYNSALLWDLSPLKETDRLETFLCANSVTDFAPLMGHKGMRNAALFHIDKAELATLLAAWPSLETLTVETTDLAGGDLAMLTGHDLKQLTITESGVDDVSALAGMIGLTDLRITYSRVTDISPIADLTNLETLVLGRNHISDLSPLAGLPNLKLLWIENNPVEDLSPLAEMASLEIVCLTIDETTPYTEEEVKAMLPGVEVLVQSLTPSLYTNTMEW